MSAQDLQQHTHAAQERLRTQFPEVLEWLQAQNTSVRDISTIHPVVEPTQITTPSSVDTEVQATLAKLEHETRASGLAQVTQEEHQEIMRKLTDWAQHPGTTLNREEELYLEQQLTDLLGFVIVAELDGYRLPSATGQVKSEPHLKRFPTDELKHHQRFAEADLSKLRSNFGWFATGGDLSEQAVEREQYYFSVPMTYFPDWHARSAELQQFFTFRKMIMINPAEKRAIIGVVGNTGPRQWMQYQFGASPEVIRWGRIWSPRAQGKVIVLFVDDPVQAIPLGIVNLELTA